MALIHFIWWGTYRGKDCVNTPNQVARNCPNHKVYFWCREAEAPIFASYLKANITVKSCSSIYEIVGQLYKGENQKWYESAQDILVYLNSVKAFSAAKDLLSIIILHTYGGYYFDTTTIITPGLENQLNNNLETTYNAPRAVQISDTKIRHYLGIQTGKSIMGWENREELADFLVNVILIDVWALYSPKNHPCFELILQSYVSRCNRMGLYPGGISMNFDKLPGSKIIQDGEIRDTLIGQLIIRSVYDGFLERCCYTEQTGLNTNNLSKFCWKAEERHPNSDWEEFGKYKVTALGINKIPRNSWRGISLSNKSK